MLDSFYVYKGKYCCTSWELELQKLQTTRFIINNRYLWSVCYSQMFPKNKTMGMNKNTVLAWATFIMILVGLGLIALGFFRYNEVAGWGFASVGIGFFAIAWVFNALKGRV